MTYPAHVLALAVLAVVHSAHAAFGQPRRRRSLTSRIVGAVLGAFALLFILLLCVIVRRRRRRAAANPVLVGPGGGGGMALGGGKPGLGFARPWGRNQNQNQGQNAMPMQQHQNQTPIPNHTAHPNQTQTQTQGAPAPPPYANGTANTQGEQGMHAQGGYAPPPGPPPPQQAHVNDKPGFVGGFKPT